MNKFYLTIYNSALLLLLVVPQDECSPPGEKMTRWRDLVECEAGGGYESDQKSIRENVCEFGVSQMESDTLPLLLTPGPNTGFFYPPAKTSLITLKKGEKIRLACPGKKNFINKFSAVKSIKDITAQCYGKNVYGYEAIPFKIDEIACRLPVVSIVRETNKKCFQKLGENEGKNVEIGFQLNSKEFVKTIDVCWENVTRTTYWTKVDITTPINYSKLQKRIPVKEISDDPLYPSSRYDYCQQQKTMKILTKSDELVNEYINEMGENNAETYSFIEKAMLTMKWCFFYPAAQRSTNWYMNHAPRWASAPDWALFDRELHAWLTVIKHPLTIYTGTQGRMSLSLEYSKNDNKSLESVPFYLSVDPTDATKKALPVPKYFWRILYNPENKNAIAFVSVNDPWATNGDAEVEEHCTSTSGESWKTHRKNAYGNYLVHTCEVDEKLRELIPTIPVLDVEGILLRRCDECDV